MLGLILDGRNYIEEYSDVAIKGKESNKIREIGFGTKIKQEG